MVVPEHAPAVRQRVEAVSRPILQQLTSLPRLVIPLVTVVLIAVGMFAPVPVALLAFVLVAAFVGWITYLAWPAISSSGKIIRLLMIALVLGLAATRL